MALILLLAFLVALSAAGILGLVPDTRDPDYSLGRVVEPHAADPVQ